jgi:glycosyltransferase involved in cell wall biosynthesis
VSGLRVLMVVNAPWDRRLGGPRVSIEMAEQLRDLGHSVDSFSVEDAFPRPPRSARLAGLTRDFEREAVAWIRAHGSGYDVIDARAGALGATKAELRFDGLLVTRSNGLLAIYEREFVAADRATAAGRPQLLTRVPRRLERSGRERRHRQGIANCDLLNVLNSDELAYARDELGIGDRTVLLLHGLTRGRAAAFAAARRPVGERIERPVVAFVGSWNRRKGQSDMAAIVAAARAAVPGLRFRFLGTGTDAAAVVGDCGGDPAGIEVVPRFESEELPELLGDVAAGILPSYVEGVPFGVLELLAAGAPVVAYDAPGARETLPRLDPTLLVERGDGGALGARLGRLLADPAELERLSAGAVAIAESLRWEEIAAETAAAYEARLVALGSSPVGAAA